MIIARMQTVLIAGASGTFGNAIARELLQRGCALGLHYHAHPQPCIDLANEAAAKNLKAAAYAANFDETEAPNALATAFLQDFGRIDALVWAAGITRDAPLARLPEAYLEAVLNVNLRAFFLLLKPFSRQFLKQRSGTVVAISSHAAIAGRAGGSAYAMAHSGLLALVKSAAREWGASGVRVNAIVPPFVVDSGMGQAASPEFASSTAARRVLKMPVPDTKMLATFVANILEAPSISGQVLSADSRIVP